MSSKRNLNRPNEPISLTDLPNLSPDKPAQVPPTLEEEVERHEYKMENIDREAVDTILTTEDVCKGGKIRLSRKGPLDINFQFVTSIPAEAWVKSGTDAMLTWCRNLFGGGEYQAMTHRADGRTYKQFTFSIDPRYKGQLDDEQMAKLKSERGSTQVIMPPATQPETLRMTDVFKIMDSSQNKSEQMMTLMMTMMMKSQESMVGMLTAILARPLPQPAAAPTMDPALLELLKAKADHPPMMEVLEMMKAIKDLQDDREPPKEEDMFDKIMKVAPALIPGLARQQIQPGPQPEALPPAPGLMGQLPLGIRLGIGQLVRAARKGSDPALYADLVIDQVADNPQNLANLKAILTDPAWKVKLFGDETQIADIGPWLDAVRDMVLSYDPSAPEDGQVDATQPTANGQAAGGNQVSAERLPAGPGPNPPVPGAS